MSNKISLTGKQRALLAMQGKPTDRISVHPAIDVSYAAKFYGKMVGECFINPEVHARALENVFSVLPEIDGLYVNLCLSPKSVVNTFHDGDVTFILDYGGMTWSIPLNDVETVGKHEIQNIDNPHLLTHNPLKDGILDTFQAISEEIKSKYLIVPGLTGPFSQLVFMLGLSETLIMIFEQPVELKQALEWRAELAIQWANEFIAAGVDSVWIDEGAASGSLISSETHEEFVMPYASEVVEYLKSHGIITIMHVCGDINESAHLIARTVIDAMDVDYMVDMQKAGNSINWQICFRGNLNPLNLLNMPYDQLVEHCIDIIRKGESPFVLSTGCLVARDTPKQNIDAMVAV